MADLKKIERLAAKYANKREQLAGVVRGVDAAMAAVMRKHGPVLERRVQAEAAARAELLAALRDSQDIFRRPKTRKLHGIRVGFAKGKGKILIADPNATVKLIRKHLPALFTTLVKVDATPIKSAINGLTAEQLRKIGCTVTETDDEPVIAPTDSDLEKHIKGLLAGVAGRLSKEGEA